MSLTLQITVVGTTSGKYAGLVEVSGSGMKEDQTHLYQFGQTATITIHGDRAYMICEGDLDFSDDAGGDNYQLNNPMAEYLRRDNPTVTLHDELRARLAAAMSRAELAEREATTHRMAVAHIRDVLARELSNA